MLKVIEILKFCKAVYEEENLINEIDEAIEILNGKDGKASEDVVKILKNVQDVYEHQEIKDAIEDALKVLED